VILLIASIQCRI